MPRDDLTEAQEMLYTAPLVAIGHVLIAICGQLQILNEAQR